MSTILSKKGAYRSCLLLFISLATLSSCVYDKEFSYLNDQIVGLNRRVTKLQTSIDSKLGKDLDTRLKSIHSNQAEMRVELDQLKGKIGNLSGRVEDNERVVKRAIERDLKEQDAIKENQTKLSQNVADLNMMVKRLYDYLDLKPLTVQEPPDQEKDTSGQTEDSRPPVDVSTEAKSLEVESYDISLASFKEGRYEEAMDGFKDFLKRFRKSDRADNAQFWIGECYMALKQYEQAILAYQEVIKKYPKGNKVPNAMLRQAIAFLEIKDKTSSKLLLKKIIKKYPKSAEAKIARNKLRRSR